MFKPPTLTTNRLILRSFTLKDASELQRLVGEWEVARRTLNIPHPYNDGMAEAWINEQPSRFKQGEGVSLAVIRKDDATLIGGIGLRIEQQHGNGTLGYWVGKPYWGRGYGTEAAQAVLVYGFEVLKLHRISADHFGTNPASGRVMQKIGMTYEGTLRQKYKRWDKFEDSVCYGILREEYLKQRQKK